MEYLLITLLLFVLELIYFRVADRYNIVDKPNQRSSHTVVTLRGGGIVFYFAALIYWIISGFENSWFMLGLTLISGISFVDDVRGVSNRLRLLLQFVAMGLLFYQLGFFEGLPWWYSIVGLIVCTGIINAYNFMDGINGITGGYSLVVLASLLAANRYVVEFADERLIVIMLLGVLVFNFFNFRKKARCFAGDVGAIGIAFVILFLLGRLVIVTGDLSYIAFLGVYGVDSVLTIVHRLMLKENIGQPHRKHVYQLMANELKIPHVWVSAIYMLVQGVVSASLIWIGGFSMEIALIALFLLGVAYILFKAKYYRLHKG